MAMYDFPAKTSEELSFPSNDSLEIINNTSTDDL